MARSEIDDIFASKGKQRAAPSSTHPQTPEDVTKKALKKKKRKRESAQEVQPLDDASEQDRPTKRRVPETVVDPSIVLAAPVKHKKSALSGKPHATKKTRKKEDKEDEERFKDSRGTGPRRKTEEGFAIYKEGELGITDTGGDTPLCPFDCQCCRNVDCVPDSAALLAVVHSAEYDNSQGLKNTDVPKYLDIRSYV